MVGGEREDPHVADAVLECALAAGDVEVPLPDPGGHSEAGGRRAAGGGEALPFPADLEGGVGYGEAVGEVDVWVAVLREFHDIGVVEEFGDSGGLLRGGDGAGDGGDGPRVVDCAGGVEEIEEDLGETEMVLLLVEVVFFNEEVCILPVWGMELVAGTRVG